jgi:hypothetical protein
MQVIFKFIALRLVIINKYIDIMNLKVTNYNLTNMLKNKDLAQASKCTWSHYANTKNEQSLCRDLIWLRPNLPWQCKKK